MGPRSRANAVEGVFDIGDPVTQCFIHCVFQGACAGRDRDDLCAEQFHAENVRLLALDIRLAHEDNAIQSEARADCRRGNTMLTGARFGDDAGLAHTPGEQDLAEAIIDLVRARMVQLIALEIDFRAIEMLGQPLRKI